MIEIAHVFKTYPSKIAALSDVSLRVSQGEFIFISGPSGSGKTTLLHILFCSEKVTSGQVIVNGVDITRKGFKKGYQLRRTIGMVFQDFKLLRDRTVGENISFALEVTGYPRKEIRKRVPAILEWVGLLERERDSILTLSGGEQQRIAIARAVVSNPPLLLADEPTGNLDDQMTSEIMTLFIALQRQGTTVVLATHNGDLLHRYRYPAVHLLGGRVISEDAKDEAKREI